MNIAILLIWIRHNITGGIESYVRNLLDGFAEAKDENRYTLICAKDNADTFRHYENDKRFNVVTCPTISNDVIKTVIYENRKIDNLITKLGVDFCFVPSYRMPTFGLKNKYIIVIHDIQSIHFPKNFHWYKRSWQKIAWRRCSKRAYKVVAISQFDKNDIVENIGADSNKIEVIYNPILPSKEFADFNDITKKYQIEKQNYFYCIAAMAKHKNLLTIIKLLALIKQKNIVDVPQKLLVSGAIYNSEYAQEIYNCIRENHLEKNCIFTGYISNTKRNSLIKNAKMFLFPSLFEGFGMPVIEALQFGTTVITTRCASIPEVSKNLAIYVNNPKDENEWLEKVKFAMDIQLRPVDFKEYKTEYATRRYLNLFKEVCEEMKKK